MTFVPLAMPPKARPNRLGGQASRSELISGFPLTRK
jgi:hypothetical protein